MKTHGKTVTALLLAAVLALGLTACARGGEDAVYAQSVAALNGMGNVGFTDRFAGVAVSGKTTEIRLDPSLTLEDVKVEEGQTVKKGDVLFTYNNDSAALSVEQAKLELESMKNKIASLNAQIADLTKERSAASGADKLSYTLEIQSLQADIRETEYNISVKEKDLKTLEETAADTQVKSEVDGRVTAINRGEDEYGDDGGEKPFMTIVETGNLRVKGVINELNRGALYEGQAVTLRARTDPAQTWQGTIRTIDWENAEQGNRNNYYDGADDEMTSSSRYPFYIDVADPAGLIIGQHVYIEPGAEDTPATGTQLRIPDSFVLDADDAPWVWAVNGRDKLEKRQITVAEYDDETGEYVIESGLTAEDWIAFPEDGLKAGMPAIRAEDADVGFEGGMEGFDGELEGDPEGVLSEADADGAEGQFPGGGEQEPGSGNAAEEE